ncbi:MAG: beta-lactamase family protein [Bryobacteraceae bacterium]|nr:beta-lactamase family protein [Bryobacteraceae bacterium]
MRSLLAFVLLAGCLQAQPLPASSPEKEGFSKERLGRLHETLARLTKSNKPPGAVSMIVRNGRIVDWQTFGLRDVEGNLPMEKDTICLVYSMTKPITSAAVMMLAEEGKLTLADRVDRFIPEFKNLKVFKGGTVERPELTAPERPMTVKHLITHTSGLTYGWGNDNVSELYRKAKVFDVGTLKEFIERAAKLPLAASPGEKYEYSISIDVLGYLVEVVSGMPFDRFVQERILNPLKMGDTHFVLPAAKRARLAKIYGLREGKLTAMDGLDAKGVPFGGMGLYSTIADYARFAQMLANGGELDGARLLSRKTVDLMMMNHLAGLARPTTGGDDSDGFGLGGAVRIDPAKAGRPGSVGLFGWDGAASTRFRVDRKERLVWLLFTQWMPFDSPTLNLFETLVYQALVD